MANDDERGIRQCESIQPNRLGSHCEIRHSSIGGQFVVWVSAWEFQPGQA